MDADVETLVVGAHGMVGQPDVLLDNVVDVRGQELVFLASRHQQDTLNDADGTFAMLHNLGHILLQVGNNVLHLLAIIFWQLVLVVFYDFGEVAKQLVRHFTEVDDKIQRILYFVCNAGTEHSERCQLLLFLQLLL